MCLGRSSPLLCLGPCEGQALGFLPLEHLQGWLWKSPAGRYAEYRLTLLPFGELSSLHKQALVCSYQNAIEISNISATHVTVLPDYLLLNMVLPNIFCNFQCAFTKHKSITYPFQDVLTLIFTVIVVVYFL